MKPPIWMLVWLLAMATMQVGLALRHSLWGDEVFSLAMATGHSLEHPPASADPTRGDYVEAKDAAPAAALGKYAEFEDSPAGPRAVVRAVYLSDTSPPLYYVVLNGWLRIFGASDLALRFLSIVFSLACVPLVFAIGRAMANERAGQFAAILFGMAPLSLYYSVEGRMYSMLWFCVLALMLATVRLWQGPGGWRIQALWIAASAAGLLVHYYFVFAWGASIFFLLVQRGQESWGRLALKTGGVLLLIAPWYMHVGDTLQHWRITQDWVNWKPNGYSRMKALRDILIRYFAGEGHYVWQQSRIAAIGALLIFAGAGAVTAWRLRWSFAKGVPLLVMIWFFFACVGPWFADLARGTYVAEYPRYGSAAMPAACLLGGWMLTTLRAPVAGVALLGIALCWTPAVMDIYRQRSRSGQPARDVAKDVAGTRAEDLIIIHSIPSGAVLLARYLTSPAPVAAWTGQLKQRTVPESIESLVAGRRRVVVVNVHSVGEPAPEEDWLRDRAKMLRSKQLGGVFISEFEPRDGTTF